MKEREKKAQVTLFIIVGITILVTIISFFIFVNPQINFFRIKENPQEKIISCIENSIKKEEERFFEEKEILTIFPINYTSYGEKAPFVCYSTEFYFPCIPQSPLFSETIRKKMENKVSRELSKCILSLKESYEKKGYSFDYESFNFSLLFKEKEIGYEGKIPITISKEKESIRISEINGGVQSILPKMLKTIETITNYESTFCEFNLITWQAINRDIKIERFRGGDQTKVYTLTSQDGKKKIKFAIRTCVMPAGI